MDQLQHTENSQPEVDDSFGPLHLLEPRTEHTHTAILLHGLGSTGEEFAEELFASNLSNGKSLQDEFPGWRWVFPSSKERWSTTFQESMPAWFEAYSLTDTTARQDLQVPGIKDSVAYLCGMVDEEIKRLGERSEKRIILGGISQGGTMAMWTLLCYPRPRALTEKLCAFVGVSTWLPFAAEMETILSERPGNSSPPRTTGDGFYEFVREMVAPLRDGLRETKRTHPLIRTPVFMGHGKDDAYVDVELGREAARVLCSIGFEVEWRDYAGAEQEGHWLKVPEEVDDIRAFLARVTV